MGISFTGWLFGGLAGNIRLKLPFSAEKLFLLGLDVLDLSYAKLRSKPHPLRRDLLKEVDASSLTDPEKKSLRDIITAEQYVARSLVCHVQEINPKDRTPKNPGLVIQEVVPDIIGLG